MYQLYVSNLSNRLFPSSPDYGIIQWALSVGWEDDYKAGLRLSKIG